MSQLITSVYLTSIITFLLFILNVSAFSSNNNEKLIMCVPRGLDPKGTKKYCQALEKMTNVSISVRCVIAQDRLECARLILEGHADFARMNPSDLIALGNIDFGDTMIAGEIRHSPDELFQYKVMLVARQEMVTSFITLKGANLCLPGYEPDPEEDWTPFHARYLEMHHVPQQCQENLTSSENRARATSTYVTEACIPGLWRVENDFELKAKFPNLCTLCTNPGQCGEHDEYWGPRGSLICLTDGRGTFAWAKYNDIQGHFKTLDKDELRNYVLICPEGHWRTVDNPLGCQWIDQPWPSILSHQSKASRTSQLLASMIGSENEEQAKALDLHVPAQQRETLRRLLSLFGKTFEPFEDTSARLFLTEATGLWAAFNSLREDRCYKSIRLCVKSQIEMTKCRWMASAALVWTAGSPIECVIANAGEDCMDAVNSKVADVVIVKPDQLYEASRTHNLKILLHEWRHVLIAGDPGVPTLAVVVKSSSDLRRYSDLRGAKACISKKYGFAWRAIEALFHKENVFLLNCPHLEDSLSNYLKINVTDSDLSSLECLSNGFDVAIVNLVNISKHYNSEYKTLCSHEKGITIKINNQSVCSPAWISPGQVMIRKDEDPWRKNEIENTLEEISDIFSGHPSKKASGTFNIFAPFDGKKNVLFHDSTVRLVRDNAHMLENAKTFWAFWEMPPYDDKTDRCYISIKPTGSSSSLLPICSLLFFLLFLLIHIIY